jgi:hypothetical protein
MNVAKVEKKQLNFRLWNTGNRSSAAKRQMRESKRLYYTDSTMEQTMNSVSDLEGSV